MATLQQLDMNILLWIQEHLRVLESSHLPGKRRMVLDRIMCASDLFRENTQNRSDSGTLAAVRVSDHKSADKKCSSPSKTF